MSLPPSFMFVAVAPPVPSSAKLNLLLMALVIATPLVLKPFKTVPSGACVQAIAHTSTTEGVANVTTALHCATVTLDGQVIVSVLTVTVVEETLLQPASVPVTVYTVVDAGVAVILDVAAPVLHKNEVAVPPAVTVTLWLPQIVVADAFAETEGNGLTVTVRLAEVEQLKGEGVTVYVVVEAGLTVIDAVVAPVLHKYAVEPEAVKVTDEPVHIGTVPPAIVATAGAVTVTVTVLVKGQAPPGRLAFTV